MKTLKKREMTEDERVARDILQMAASLVEEGFPAVAIIHAEQAIGILKESGFEREAL